MTIYGYARVSTDGQTPESHRLAALSRQIDEAKCQQIGLAKCPFERTTFEVKDGQGDAAQ
jgi:DNA invertase Pin-like site-specific DNA recombinase